MTANTLSKRLLSRKVDPTNKQDFDRWRMDLELILDDIILSLNSSGGADYVKVSDVKPANTVGGTPVIGSWQTRIINTEDSDAGGICSVASNQITLAPGTYITRIASPFYGTQRTKIKLYNITDASDTLIGSSHYAGYNTNIYHTSTSEAMALVSGKFIITAQKTFEVQYQCGRVLANNGLGVESNFGVVEVYTVAEFWRVNK